MDEQNRMTGVTGYLTTNRPSPEQPLMPNKNKVELSKEVFDRTLAFIAIILLIPLCCVIAVCIKSTSRGPILFKQKRTGLHGEPFFIYKFRSMRPHDHADEVVQAKRGDGRVTRVGRFLRKTSLDELPQFINVLFGDMSLVGPRPHAVDHDMKYSKLIDSYALRYRVKPGITGWAQIHGYRGETDTLVKMEKRIEHDLYYIEHCSFWLDMKIVVWTAIKGWKGDNAY